MTITDEMVEAAAAQMMQYGVNAPESTIYAAANSALQAALSAQWRPIESAPRDGADILLFTGSVIYVGSSRLPMRGEPSNESHYEYEWRDGGGRWASPTHWMPLPLPPTVEGK